MPPRRHRPVTIWIRNPKTGRDVEVRFTFDSLSEGAEWWTAEAFDPEETDTTAPDGMISASAVVFDPISESDFGNMHEPLAFAPRAGAGLCLYLASALFAAKRGRLGIRASDCLSHESKRLWEKMIEHGVATNRGLDVGPVGALYASTVATLLGMEQP